MSRQPWVHDLAVTVHGNVTALSSSGADMSPGTAEGLYVDDTRALDRFQVLVGGESPSPISLAAIGPRAEFFAAARGLGDRGADPTVEVRRTRVLDGTGLQEVVTITSRAAEAVTADMVIELGSDGAPISSVKTGLAGTTPLQPAREGDAVAFSLPRHHLAVEFDPRPDGMDVRVDRVVVRWALVVEPGESQAYSVTVTPTRSASSDFDADAGSAALDWDGVRVTADDPRLQPLVAQSMADLQHLLLRDPLAPGDVFAAAGTPWYLTLFGRDSLWSARMMLPFGTELAAGTLRTLARRQGTTDAPDRAEQPGKILHEVRPTAHGSVDGHLALPSLYYGTVDATALWVALLVDAWRWGMPEPQVRDLLPALRAALGWITGPGQADDGFLRYLDTTGTGLVNQGWKDSDDSMRFRDGRIAEGPIALIEAQAYAVEALLGAACLLDGLGEDGGSEARTRAGVLRARIADAFWVDDASGRYLAMALDRDGRPIDGLGSNMGHALGTGVLTPQEAAEVAARLTGPELLDPFGIRTLGRDNGGFNPIGYHTGSIWTHDSAIVALGLLREGHGAEAAQVVRALAASGAAFDDRWPELYSGLPLMRGPAPYPASCRPQAWSAASAGVLITVALGLRADLPSGLLDVRPVRPAPFGAVRVQGIRLGPHTLTVEVNREGVVRVDAVPEGVQLRVAT